MPNEAFKRLSGDLLLGRLDIVDYRLRLVGYIVDKVTIPDSVLYDLATLIDTTMAVGKGEDN